MKNVFIALLIVTLTLCICNVTAVDNRDILAAVRRNVILRRKKIPRRNLATKAPKAVSTKAPSGCADSKEKFEVDHPTHGIITVGCKPWVQNNVQRRCNLFGDFVREYCPVTCGVCDSDSDSETTCEDVEGRFAAPSVKWLKEKISCRWVAREDTKWRCTIKEVKENCKETCGLC